MDTSLLHNHPFREKDLGLEPDHVIVDKADWEEVRLIIKLKEDIEDKKLHNMKRVDITISFNIPEGETKHPDYILLKNEIQSGKMQKDLSSNPPFEIHDLKAKITET